MVFSEKAPTREKKMREKKIENGKEQEEKELWAGFNRDEGAIKREKLRRVNFIIATNELESEELSDKEAFTAYKEQQSVESGFRFLKYSSSFAHMFLESEDRIVAMLIKYSSSERG